MPRNYFGNYTYREETIYNPQDEKIGTIRVKPSAILWKSAHEGKFRYVSLDEFIKWMESKSDLVRW